MLAALVAQHADRLPEGGIGVLFWPVFLYLTGIAALAVVVSFLCNVFFEWFEGPPAAAAAAAPGPNKMDAELYAKALKFSEDPTMLTAYRAYLRVGFPLRWRAAAASGDFAKMQRLLARADALVFHLWLYGNDKGGKK